MQVQHGDLGLVHRRESRARKCIAHLPAGEPRPHRRLGLPDADDVQRVLTDSAVVAQLPRRPTGIHDRSMGAVKALVSVSTSPRNRAITSVGIRAVAPHGHRGTGALYVVLDLLET